jgi:hypothetical protein
MRVTFADSLRKLRCNGMQPREAKSTILANLVANPVQASAQPDLPFAGKSPSAQHHSLRYGRFLGAGVVVGNSKAN